MKKILTVALLSLLASGSAFGQKKEVGDENYKRSSLAIIFIDEAGSPSRELIRNTVIESPVPDKYNDHNPPTLTRHFDPAATEYVTSKADRDAYLAEVQKTIDAQTPEGKKAKKAKSGVGTSIFKGLLNEVIKETTGMEKTVILDDENLTDYGVRGLMYLNRNKVAAMCKAQGIIFGYHNHDAEFRAVEGQVWMDYVIEHTSPDVMIEMDVFWVAKGGVDPVAYINKYAGRFPLLHIKDDSVIGASGKMDFKGIFEAAYAQGMKDYYVEVEEYFPSSDPNVCVQQSLDFLEMADYVK